MRKMPPQRQSVASIATSPTTNQTPPFFSFIIVVHHLIAFPLLPFLLFSLLVPQGVQALRQQSPSIGTKYQQHPQQRMCFQCHMPQQCKSGFCFGDFCVKSLVADKYVSKGCENRSSIIAAAAANGVVDTQGGGQDHGPLYARSALGNNAAPQPGNGGKTLLKMMPIVPSLLGIAPGCIKMNVFGQPNVICYCNDADYCNGATTAFRVPSFSLLLPLLLLIATALSPDGIFNQCCWRRWWTR